MKTTLTAKQRKELLDNFTAEFDRSLDRVLSCGALNPEDYADTPMIPARMALVLAAEGFNILSPSAKKDFKNVRIMA